MDKPKADPMPFRTRMIVSYGVKVYEHAWYLAELVTTEGKLNHQSYHKIVNENLLTCIETMVCDRSDQLVCHDDKAPWHRAVGKNIRSIC